ncbi:DEAD-domain-containing protein [Polychaeton citri CBS 116435]|uniref:RNA helicase n=1 Tax=Polychaeton citri CBS 116435 TaxID=1314669 RepID=A0A9P4Q1X9_9PEZI|nr:DEAD-domain-containing protein [Polychaeton citri CBS 116435]
MMGRAASPALSENEVDISRGLFGDDIGSDSETEAPGKQSAGGISSAFPGESDDDSQDEAFIAATQVTANRRSENKHAKKAGAFQTMGLNANLLKAITRKGFSIPTPIQRKCVPLILDGQDVVGMARTGSGKTAAFVMPMIERLKSHSAKVGARAVVLSPSRELALQTLKVVKEMARGTDLRACLLVGGDSLEEQFGAVASNPDIIIATPGRFEHLKVEMGLELNSVKYVVFDEADRLFEMGFAAQLTEIMHSLPSNRQTLLFSATLPKSLVEFARAGLQEPKLVRLDVEGKISPGLESAFFTVKAAEKEGALLHILQDVIKMPVGSNNTSKSSSDETGKGSKKRKRSASATPNANTEAPSAHSTVIFAATKHHVDYLATFLQSSGYATSYVYGSLDQTARKIQTQEFRSGKTNILVVTDVAARGLDIPVLVNVINYDFPSQPKIFVHRVGRTARAGKSGWAYSLIGEKDMPYLIDLQLFLGRKLVVGRGVEGVPDRKSLFKDCIVVGTLVRDSLERHCEEAGKIIDEDIDLSSMRDVASKGEKQYMRTRSSASAESVKKSKQLGHDEASKGANLLFENCNQEAADLEKARLDMLTRVSGFRPQETVFEIGKRGEKSDVSEFMRMRRAKVIPKNRVARKDDGLAEADDVDAGVKAATANGAGADAFSEEEDDEDELVLTRPNGAGADSPASDDDLEMTLTEVFGSQSAPGSKRAKSTISNSNFQDPEVYMSYTPVNSNLAEEKAYSVNPTSNDASASSFLAQARDATMDLTADESKAFALASRPNSMKWDRKHKKYVSSANDADGNGKKFITSESGLRVPASFRSGRFDAWRKANRISKLPRVGDQERQGSGYNYNARSGGGGDNGGRFKHKSEKAPKAADKFRDDYYRKVKKVEEAREKGRGRFQDTVGKDGRKIKGEIKGVEDVRKARNLQQKRKDKNARPSRRK